MNSLGMRSAGLPLTVGPIVKAANWPDFDIPFWAPDYQGQVEGADIYANTTCPLEATNFLTITLQKITDTGAGAATTIADRTTNNSGGTAITAARRNAMTMTATLANARYNGRDSEPSGDTDIDLLNLDFNAATATVAALDVMMIAVRITPGAQGHLS